KGEPDPLEPDDHHEHHAPSGDRPEEPREVPRGEGPDPEELETEHRVPDPSLDEHERDEEGEPHHDARPDPGTRPAHALASVGKETVGHRDQEQGKTDPERGVPDIVDPLAFPDLGDIVELEVGPDRPANRERDAREEDHPPRRQDERPDVNVAQAGEDTAENQSDD